MNPCLTESGTNGILFILSIISALIWPATSFNFASTIGSSVSIFSIFGLINVVNSSSTNFCTIGLIVVNTASILRVLYTITQ